MKKKTTKKHTHLQILKTFYRSFSYDFGAFGKWARARTRARTRKSVSRCEWTVRVRAHLTKCPLFVKCCHQMMGCWMMQSKFVNGNVKLTRHRQSDASAKLNSHSLIEFMDNKSKSERSQAFDFCVDFQRIYYRMRTVSRCHKMFARFHCINEFHG